MAKEVAAQPARLVAGQSQHGGEARYGGITSSSVGKIQARIRREKANGAGTVHNAGHEMLRSI